MQSKLLLLLGASLLVAGEGTDAPPVTGNTPGLAFKASLPKSEKTPIRGYVSARGASDGKGVQINVKLTGLPAELGPFLYHIHEKPVPADGNCTGTGPHLTPYGRADDPPCDAKNPGTCQPGDLSGKHGKPVSGTYVKMYSDEYLSNVAGQPAFYGNRSIVVHDKDKKRLTCANFVVYVPKNSTSSTTHASASVTKSASVSTLPATTTSVGTASVIPPTTTSAAATSPISTGGATVQGASFAAVILGGFALFL